MSIGVQSCALIAALECTKSLTLTRPETDAALLHSAFRILLIEAFPGMAPTDVPVDEIELPSLLKRESLVVETEDDSEDFSACASAPPDPRLLGRCIGTRSNGCCACWMRLLGDDSCLSMDERSCGCFCGIFWCCNSACGCASCGGGGAYFCTATLWAYRSAPTAMDALRLAIADP